MRAGESDSGSAMLLAVILLSVLVILGGTLAMTAGNSATAARRRTQAVEADYAARSALTILAQQLERALATPDLRSAMVESFGYSEDEAMMRLQRTLEGLDVGSATRLGDAVLNGRVTWSISRLRSGDPRSYRASYTLLGIGRTRGDSAVATLELQGDTLLSIGHLPLSHYQMLLGGDPPELQAEYAGPVRFDGDARLRSGTLFRADLEIGPGRCDGLDQCTTRARVVQGLPPVESAGAVIEDGQDGLTWERLRLKLRMEPIEAPPPPGIYFDGDRAIFVEGDVTEMVAAGRGDEQYVDMRHTTLGQIVVHVRPEISWADVGGVAQPSVIGACDRLLVHGSIGSLQGGTVDGFGNVTPNPAGVVPDSPAFVRSLTVAASSGVTVTGSLLAAEGVSCGLVAQKVAGEGTPGFRVEAPGRQVRIDAHLYLAGGRLEMSAARVIVHSVQLLQGAALDPSAPLTIEYPAGAEGGVESAPGYPVTREVVAYVGWPIARLIRRSQD